MAIRQNSDNMYQMKKAIGATLYHCTALEEIIRHQFCPQTVDSWCKWQSDKTTGINTYTLNINLSEVIKDILWSADSSQSTIFRDLSDDVLLAKCLHNYAQNQNEALNSVIWKKCPKHIFVKKDSIEMGVCSALLNYNGAQGVCNVARNAGLKVGHFTINACILKDKGRTHSMVIKQSKRGEVRRTRLRGYAKGWIDVDKEIEGGDSYSAGAY